jgi:hypothetical protein
VLALNLELPTAKKNVRPRATSTLDSNWTAHNNRSRTRIELRQFRTASMSVDYLLHESALGYAIFKVVNQADTIGNRLKEVQAAVQDLAKFGKVGQDYLIPLGRSRLTLLDR